MEMKHGLTRSRPDVDDHTVVLQLRDCRRLGHELEHSLRFVRTEQGDLAERLDVAFGQHEKVNGSLRRQILDREEALGAIDDRRRDLASGDPKKTQGSLPVTLPRSLRP